MSGITWTQTPVVTPHYFPETHTDTHTHTHTHTPLENCLLVKVSIAVRKHHNQKSKLGRKGFIGLTLPPCGSSLKEVRTGTQIGQEPRGRS